MTSPGFLIGLAVLLLNDFILKRELANELTGKLSDFAGLWIFPAFFAAVVPARRDQIYLLTAAAFVWWKSPTSQGVIDLWNSVVVLDVKRVVDWTDLVALVALPASYIYFTSRTSLSTASSWRTLILAGVALFAFTATTCEPSVKKTVAYEPGANVYAFAVPKSDLVGLLDRIDDDDREYSPPLTPFFSFTYDVGVRANECGATFGGIDFRAEFVDLREGRSEVRLNDAFVACDNDLQPDELKAIFEREVIDKLRERLRN